MRKWQLYVFLYLAQINAFVHVMSHYIVAKFVFGLTRTRLALNWRKLIPFYGAS